jgi:DNA anti-recombination protein RmuC
MLIKMLESRGINGIPAMVGDVVEVAAALAKEFSAKGWAITEDDAKAKALDETKKADLVEKVAEITMRVEDMGKRIDKAFEAIDTLSEKVAEMEEKIEAFEIDPELMVEPEVENREADQAKTTAKRDAAGKKKGK